MLKKLSFIGLLLVYFSGNAQSNFEFQRTWGTYFGPVGGRSWSATFQGKQLFFDSQNNIYTKGLIVPIASYGTSYYQQYSMGGGQNFYLGNNYSYTNVTSKFNSSGNMLSYEYNQFHYGLPGSYTKELMFIDQQNNKYFQYQHNSNTPPITISTGAWMTTNSQYLLAKYDANDNLMWSTYMPSLGRVITDPSGNVYISGTTYSAQDVGTPGVFQENYQDITVNGSPYPNGFLVKLDPNGQRIWGTYYPGYASIIHYHNNALYIGIGQEPSSNQISLTTPNAFQTTKSHFALLKMNANNGTREWGTYYGYPITGSSSIRKFEVNESGIYILGDESFSNNSNTNSPNYYGTAGSHQPQLSGAGDLFLTKFSHSGERLWSTYVGGNGREIAQSSQQPLAVSGDNIYVCGLIWGVSNNIATPNVYQQNPGQNLNTSTNRFFSKFNSDGILQWSSYYGGTSQSGNEPINIAINNNSLYLYGETTSTTGFSTPGSWQPQYVDPNPSAVAEKNVTFLAKFDVKNLDTQELTKISEIKLYNNPNNGNFTISGDLFKKEEYKLIIFDLSGKLIHREDLGKTANGEHHFSLENKLTTGNYMVNITSQSGNLIRNFKMSVKK